MGVLVAPLLALTSSTKVLARARSGHARFVTPRADAGEGVRLFGRPLSTEDTRRSSSNISLSILKSIAEVPREQWDACVSASCAGPVAGRGAPFIRYGFLHALEMSKSVDASEGWMPQHLVAHDKKTGRLVAAVPLFLKSHSYGEYVFDTEWARAYRTSHRQTLSGGGAGSGGGSSGGASARSYYPKLQCCVPFTPVTGPRLLIADVEPEQRVALRAVLARGLVTLAERLGVSGLHVTFTTAEDQAALVREGFLPRLGLQYHWCNDGYVSFESYLAALKPSRRRAVRRERRKVADAGIIIRRYRGAEIEPRHWEAFYRCYRTTVDAKWGHDYLKRPFFDALSRESPEALLLILAERRTTGEVVAGALNLVGADCVYGRNWGCLRRYDSLHFELCYYQAIEVAIELGLPRVEAGAQGEHKLARGYLPTLTSSAHYLRDPSFRAAISTSLATERERAYVALTMLSTQQNPFHGHDAAERHLSAQGVHIEGTRIVVNQRRI